MMGDFAINSNADIVNSLRNWEGTTALSISSRASVIRHYDKPKKWVLRGQKLLIYLVISGLMGPWQRASQMLLNLNKKTVPSDKTLCDEDDEEIGVEMKTN